MVLGHSLLCYNGGGRFWVMGLVCCDGATVVGYGGFALSPGHGGNGRQWWLLVYFNGFYG